MIFTPSRGDFNGFLRSLGASKRKLNIGLYTSSNYVNSENVERVPWLVFEYDSSRWASKNNDTNPFFQINFKNHYISITNYSIKHPAIFYSQKGWIFSASNDNFSSSIIIDTVSNYEYQNDYETVIRAANYSTKTIPAFNSFRFSMTQPSISDNIMRICYIELFGRVFTSYHCTLTPKHRYHSFSSFMIVILFY